MPFIHELAHYATCKALGFKPVFRGMYVSVDMSKANSVESLLCYLAPVWWSTLIALGLALLNATLLGLAWQAGSFLLSSRDVALLIAKLKRAS